MRGNPICPDFLYNEYKEVPSHEKKVCLDERLPQESEFKEGYEKAKEALLEKTGDASVLEGAIEIHHKLPLENLEAEEYMMPRDVLKEEMKKAGVDVAEAKPKKESAENGEEEPKVTAADTMMEGFSAEPELNPIEAVEAISYNASAEEVAEEMKEAGLVQEKPEKEKAEIPKEETEETGETGVDLTMEGFAEDPELTPIEEVDAIRHVASFDEVKDEMKDAGLMPEEPEEEKTEAPKEETEETGETGVDLTMEGFAEDPELTPIEEVDAIRHVASFDEVKDEMKDAGLMPEEPEK
ncbi:MAG: hypothetical protein LUF00_02285 [Lachnospiraceae bacterium]|nr:hypothetical protein [Lachnospiraceae bacterium]